MSDATEQVVDQSPTVEQGGQEAAPPQPDPIDERLKGLESALSAERSKRQEAERTAAYWSGAARNVSTPQQPKSEPPKPPVNEDEFWSNPIGALEKVVSHHLTQYQSKAEQTRTQRRAERIDRQVSRHMQKHADFKDAYDSFLTAAHRDQRLAHDAWNADNAAEYVYDWYQSSKTSGDESSKKIAELEAKIAELTGQKPPPQSQAGARGTGVPPSGAPRVPDDPWAKDW